MPQILAHLIYHLLLGLALISLPGMARAEMLEQQLPGGLPVNAEYLPADAKKPAILVLHGFLQTYEFMATRNIVNGLSALGYTVLAPNLSLGVPNRKQSMQCMAAHNHTFDDDLAEIDFWVTWLQKQGYSSIILVGHSWGSQHILGYKIHNPNSPVSAIIAISLVRTHESAQIQAKQIINARARLQQHDKSLQAYNLSFCKEFMATPQSYLSYVEWDDKHVIDVLSQLQKQKIPVSAIIGGQDKRIDQAWLQLIQHRVSSMTVIEGANHFFSHVYEFELNDQLEKILPTIVK